MCAAHAMCQAPYVLDGMAGMLATHETSSMTDHQPGMGRAIKRLRKQRELSQAALGEFAGLDQPAISRIEKGTQGLSIESMTELARGLGVSISGLWAAIEGQSDSKVAELPAPKRQRPKPPTAPTHTDIDIDELRAAQTAIAIAITTLSKQGAGEAILEQIEKIGKEHPEFLEKEGSVVLLKKAVELALSQKAKAHKPSHGRGGA